MAELGIDNRGAPSDIMSSTVLDAAEAAGLGVVMVRVDDGIPHPLYSNQAAARMLGYSVPELLSLAPLTLVAASDLDALRERLVRGFNGDAFELRMLHRAGHEVPLEVAPCTLGVDGARLVVSFFLDISARKNAELASVASEARFRQLIESAPDGIAISKRGVFVYVNPAAARLLAFPAHELLGKSIGAFLDDHGRRTFVERLAALRAGGQAEPTEYRARRSDGSWITAEIVSLPFEWEGEPAMIAFARDVTERARVAAQLKHADRLASIGTLAAGVAHEINNPLTFMTLGVELLAKRVTGSELKEEEQASMLATLAELRRGAERVAEIVRDLRTFSRADDQAWTEVDLAAVVHSAERMVDHRARHFARLSVKLDGLPAISANASRLEQVFVNLLLNACQAFGEDHPDNTIEVLGGLLPDDRVYVEIVDNGQQGIAADVLPRIFDPFFTTKPVGEGTGLGLAICHGIVTQMGGAIVAESRPGRTAFRVELPLPEKRVLAPVESPLPSLEGARLRVLVVDDEPSVVRVIERTLSHRHHVETACSAAEALSLIDKGTFDAVLCDLAMPGTSGIDLLERLRTLRPELAKSFVVMTGGAVSSRMRTFLDEWRGPHLDKPFSAGRLEQVVQAAAGRGDAAEPG